MSDPISNSHALLQVELDRQVVANLRARVVNISTGVVASLSGIVALLFLWHGMGWLQFKTFEMVSLTVQVNTAIGLGLFSLTAALVRFVNTPAASLHLSRLMSLLLAGVVVYFLPDVTLTYAFPQAIWLPILFAAATVSGRWAALTAALTFAGLAILHPDSFLFRAPASLAVAVALLALILALRWLFDAGLRTAALSHERVLTTLRVDALTGLPNRARLMELLTDLGASPAGFKGTAVARLDIDGFGALCDALGADAADEILVQVGSELRESFGSSVRAARIGADDFAVILLSAGAQAAAELRTEEILVGLSRERTVRGRQLSLTVKAGVAVGGGHSETAEGLLHRADLALSEAKRHGQRYFVSPSPAASLPTMGRNFEIAQALVGAAERGELAVVYQPIVDLASGRISKAEALLRWNHPALGAVSPVDFIPIAEQSGTIHRIGDWVAAEAAAFTAAMRRDLAPDLQMSINRSPVQFREDSDNEPECVRIFRRHGLPAGAVVLEITEGVLLDGREANRRRLARLRALGIGLSLDDFGTGYASLAQLHAFEIDIVKIDRRFVSGLAQGNREHALCAGIIGLAHSLGMKVTAEGVETAEQRDLLLGLGCDFGQGWLFGRPVDAVSFEALLRGQG